VFAIAGIRHITRFGSRAGTHVLALVAFCGCRGLLRAASASDQLAVEMASGRTFIGQADEATDGSKLYLRYEIAGARVVRRLDWERVVKVRVGKDEFSAEEFRRRLPGPTAGDENPFRDEPEAVPRPRALRQVTVARRPASSVQVTPPDISGQLSRVTSLQITAAAANWDSDVETDGLLLRVCPLDAQGEVVPVQGTVDVDLVGDRPPAVYGGEVNVQLGRWSQSISPEQATAAGFVLRLPFQAVHPDFENNVGSFGVVHARLAVPGRGLFTASTGMVRVREFNLLRERMLQSRGVRFFPQEETGRGVPVYTPGAKVDFNW